MVGEQGEGKGRDPFVQPRSLSVVPRPRSVAMSVLHAVALLVKLGLAGLQLAGFGILVRSKHAATGKKRGRP